ncbi:DUF4365 domain-containing protein [Kitasatospora sp. NPDC058478]|uniref:DUF4365 domain-containing protein n=1 Tax=unclassified Kitasatospora TaxID=2633591 RepID=UPI00364B60CA
MAKVLGTKKTERAGVNEFRSLMESAGHIVQEIDGGNDYGEDCYLSFTEHGRRTGDIVAVQVKSGLKYRRAVGYGIPCRDHIEDWSLSRIPVIGVVYDPEIRKLFWVNLTEYLLSEITKGKRPRSVPLSETSILDRSTISAAVAEVRSFIARDDHFDRQTSTGLRAQIGEAIRRRRHRDSNHIEEHPLGGHSMPSAVAEVEFHERHPKLLGRSIKLGTYAVMALVLAMEGPGLYQAAEREDRPGWLWLICFYGTIMHLLNLGKEERHKKRRYALRYGAYTLLFSGWYVGIGHMGNSWPVNYTFEWIFVDEMPVVAQVCIFQIGAFYVRREYSKRRRLRNAYGDSIPEE